MASRNNNHRAPLTRPELTFWKAAYLASFVKRASRRVASSGAAHLASDDAAAAVRELRSVKQGGV